MKVVLLRVGIDAGEGGMQGPLFPDGTFEFVWIPEGLGRAPALDSRTYGNTIGRAGRPLVDYFPEKRRAKMSAERMHVDPEFETFTDGDPTTPKRGLAKLVVGDLLVLYAGLEGWGWVSAPALYIVGYFEVARADWARELSSGELQSVYAANAHVRDPELLAAQLGELLLVKGGPGSRLLNKAVCISEIGSNSANQPLKILAMTARSTFGTFGGRESLQRSNPRWVPPEFVPIAAHFVRSLE